jgi:hypothetical protein
VDGRADSSVFLTYRARWFSPTQARSLCGLARCIATPCRAVADMRDLISIVAPIVMPSRAASFRAPARFILNRILSSVGALAHRVEMARAKSRAAGGEIFAQHAEHATIRAARMFRRAGRGIVIEAVERSRARSRYGRFRWLVRRPIRGEAGSASPRLSVIG